MDSGQRNQSGGSGRNPLPGSEFLAAPLGGSMDAPPMPVADTFATEMELGSTPGPDAETRGGQGASADAAGKASDSASGAADKAKSVAADASSNVQSAVADAKSTVQDAVSDPSGAAQDIAEKVKSAAPETLSRAKDWVAAHPLVAVGAGLIGGMVLGGSGGGGSQHHHHYHGDSGSDQHASGSTQSESSKSSSGQQAPGGLLGIIQQTGLLEIVTQSADRLMKSANTHAAELMRQRVPGFDEQMSQKTGSSAPVASSTPPVRVVAPARPTNTTPLR